MGKGSKPLMTPMAPPLRDLLYDYILGTTDLKGQTWLISQHNGRKMNRRLVEKMTHRWGVAADVPNCIPHRFRHTFGTRLLEEGVDLRVIQVLMAHADIKDTSLYVKVANEQTAAAVLKLPRDWGGGVGLPGL